MSSLNCILDFVKFKLPGGGETIVIKIWNPITCLQLTFQRFFKLLTIKFSFRGDVIRLTHHSYIFGPLPPFKAFLFSYQEALFLLSFPPFGVVSCFRFFVLIPFASNPVNQKQSGQGTFSNFSEFSQMSFTHWIVFLI